MLFRFTDWFLDHELKFALGLGVISVAIVFLVDQRGPQALVATLLALAIIAVGRLLIVPDTSANWLSTSSGGTFRNIAGWALTLIGWVILLRGVIALAIASLVLRAG